MWLDELDDVEQVVLVTAYTRRKQWEFRALAVSVVNALAEAMGEGGGKGTGSSTRRVSAGEFVRVAREQ